MAIRYAKDKALDFDLRQWSISGLAQLYFGRKEVVLLRLFHDMLNDDCEDEYLKPTLLRGILGVYGLKSQESFKMVGTLDKVNKDVLSKYNLEMEEIEKIISESITS